MQRRNFLAICAALGLNISNIPLSLAALKKNGKTRAKVVVIGGGFSGATAAKYLKLLSNNSIDVSLIEPNRNFISCPMSNRVIGGDLTMKDITLNYNKLSTKYGIKLINASAENINLLGDGGYVNINKGAKVNFDKLIIAPGIELLNDKIIGYDSNKYLHAWKAGEQTLKLHQQLQSMPNGGVYIITIPLAPFRCPPGPYERACLVANYLKKNKPKSKVIILDANPEIISKPALFKKIWQEQYAQIIEYHSNFNVNRVENNTVFNELDDKFSADVLNIIPPMQAGKIATANGFGKPWCTVDYKTFNSSIHKDVYIIGDAIVSPAKMPKSGHIANQHGKYAAYAIVASLQQAEILAPTYNNTCYSFGDSTQAGHIAAVYKYDEKQKNMLIVPESSAISPSISLLEGDYAKGWAQGIWLDVLG